MTSRVYWSLVLLLIAAVSTAQVNSTRDVWVIDIEGAIGPATSDYVIRGIAAANQSGAELIVLRMNTPGGLDSAMRDIIQSVLSSNVPVANFVAPKGSRAASAGTYISYASHIAAMAPATNLGAATPVQLAAPDLPASPGQPDEPAEAPEGSAMDKKMVNDAAAYIRGLADLRNRNADWAELAVREAASLDAESALKEGVIDLIAENVEDLIAKVDGRKITMDSGEIILSLETFQLVKHEPDWRTKILSIITDPSIVLVLGMIGMYGVILEFYNPGSLIPGVVGVICLLLAAYAVQLLPLSYAGLALLTLGIGLMVAEAMVPSFGILGIGGVIAFSIGGLMLFDTEMEAFKVGIPTIAATAVVSALLIFATINIALKVRRQPVSTGKRALIGETGVALEDFEGEGQVRVGGEIWRARSQVPLADGDPITIEEVDGLLLTVKRTEGETS